MISYRLLLCTLFVLVAWCTAAAEVQNDKFIFSIYGAASNSTAVDVTYTKDSAAKFSNISSGLSPRIGVQIGGLLCKRGHIGIDASYARSLYANSEFSISQNSIAIAGYGTGYFPLKSEYYLLLGGFYGFEYSIFEQQDNGFWNDTIALQFGGGKTFNKIRIEFFINARGISYDNVVFIPQKLNNNLAQDSIVMPESAARVSDITKYDASTNVVHNKPTLYLLLNQEETKNTSITDLRPSNSAIEYGLRLSTTF
ncbi:hypothetical protein Fsol_00073 [Candidatus Fokinia solitaria]|uniref:Outer membrane protein beta-barrel domain-containing protein n=1 Tax=Candidatus Fokinia solitaria TaxID=1802984 RepID=A0A2U8BRB1_9RICK|nr:hypothetical protein [Candidatus Fokinia solitaria]AWD32886.1 hypothetical protein Fsol_00073 [Candidatus Fokinia solitaria]